MRLPGHAGDGLPPGEPFDVEGASFSAMLRRARTETSVSSLRWTGEGEQVGGHSGDHRQQLEHVEGTTVLALTYADGVVMAGDRRATAGMFISKRDMRKIFEADGWSATAVSGAAGPGMELAKVFATELEHYEKVEGAPLSLEGKANRLGHMVAAQLPMAMQGLAVVPLFAGYDPDQGFSAIYEFDPAGGRYQEAHFATTGSGGRDARGSLKARYDPEAGPGTATDVAIEALWDAADEDAATGGPDLVRDIYPLVAVIDADGYHELDEARVAERVEAVISARQS